MARISLLSHRRTLGAAIILLLFPACTSTELSLGRNDVANPRAASGPLPALTPLGPSTDPQPMEPPAGGAMSAHHHHMSGEMKMDGSDTKPMTVPVGDAGMNDAGMNHAGMKMMGHGSEKQPGPPSGAKSGATHWTCTMHPEIDRLEPGKCPICGMKLVPKADDAVDGGVK